MGFRFQNQYSGLVATVVGQGNGAPIQQKAYVGDSLQEWEVDVLPNSVFSFVNDSSAKYLDADENQITQSPGRLQQWDSTGKDNQIWIQNDLGNGVFWLQNKQSLLAMELHPGDLSVGDGGRIVEGGYSNSPWQQWTARIGQENSIRTFGTGATQKVTISNYTEKTLVGQAVEPNGLSGPEFTIPPGESHPALSALCALHVSKKSQSVKFPIGSIPLFVTLDADVDIFTGPAPPPMRKDQNLKGRRFDFVYLYYAIDDTYLLGAVPTDIWNNR